MGFVIYKPPKLFYTSLFIGSLFEAQKSGTFWKKIVPNPQPMINKSY